MTSALTRRTKLLLVVAALAVALLANVAWVAFGPDREGNRRHELESLISKTYARHGAPVRGVACNETGGAWGCSVQPARGGPVQCSLGGLPRELFAEPEKTLSNACRSS